jgi:hypothetical protein
MIKSLAKFPLLRAEGTLGAEVPIILIREILIVAVVIRRGFVVDARRVGCVAGGVQGRRVLVEVLVSVAGGGVQTAGGVALVAGEGAALGGGGGRWGAEGGVLGVRGGGEGFVVSWVCRRCDGATLGTDLLALAVVLGRDCGVGGAAAGTARSSLGL